MIKKHLLPEIKNRYSMTSKMIIGGAGALIGLLGSDKSNVKLIFNVEYADGHSEVVVERANSKKAKMLLNLPKSAK